MHSIRSLPVWGDILNIDGNQTGKRLTTIQVHVPMINVGPTARRLDSSSTQCWL